ncbi:calcium-activated chloride channel regulator 1-like isoform X3 [Artemia franciscana]|uniref:calcium-activated chloride channel regulator 1-like isoform X3 n=1 Tax=Artemia franciscana TaxID=6661 RepID=UPI0032DA536D
MKGMILAFGLKQSFVDASSALHDATDQKLFFRSATVLLPTVWSNCQKQVEPATGESCQDAEFRIENSSPLFGDSVYTQQSKGCGKRGDFVQIPTSFYDMNSNTHGHKGKTLLHEWAKVRYGVFDEFGFPNDKIYPTFYESEERDIHTGCSNEPVLGTITCDPTSSDNCHLTPNGDNSKVTSSLMYMHYLENVSQFCNETTHNRFAPTKQNLLCHGRSTQSVINSNLDFQNLTMGPVSIRRTAFTYKRIEKSRFVLVIDNSKEMELMRNFYFVRSAVRRFILEDLPTGTELGLVIFDSLAINLTDGTVSLDNDDTRKHLFGEIPEEASQLDSKCLTCAINKAIETLEFGGKLAGGNSVIIVTTPLRGMDLDSIEVATSIATQKNVKLSVIAFNETFEGHSVLTSKTNGYFGIVPLNVLPPELHLTMLTRLVDELLAALHHQATHPNQEIEIPITIHEKASNTTSIIEGTFTLDRSIARDVLFAVYFYDQIKTGVRKIQITAPDGTIYSSRSDEHKPSNYFTPGIQITEPGLWSYVVERDGTSKQPHIVKVTTRQFSAHGEKLSVKIFTSVETAEGNATIEPIKLFAEVKQGRQPVLNAKVEATVTSNQHSFAVPIPLFDNGNGDPDVTENDGIYSRYLPYILGNRTEYSISVSVHGYEDQTFSVYDSSLRDQNQRSKRAISLDPAIVPMCCGSSVTIPSHLKKPISTFSRITVGPLLVASGYASEDLIPPGRISDLYVTSGIDRTIWNFTWTATGGDLDYGVAQRYDLRYGHNPNLINDEMFESLDQVGVSRPPSPAGLTDYVIGNFDHLPHFRPIFFALRAIDLNGNKGPISNIVEVFVAKPVSTTTPGGSGGPPPGGSILTDAEIAGIAFGSALALGLILLVIVICLQRRKEKSAQYRQNLNGIHLNKGIKTIKATENETKRPIAVIPTQDPMHWSASELLQEHEKRHRNSTIEPHSYVRDFENRYASMSDVTDSYSRSAYIPESKHVGPPTLPKPKRPESQLGSELGSQSSLASDRRRRNITQV